MNRTKKLLTSFMALLIVASMVLLALPQNVKADEGNLCRRLNKYTLVLNVGDTVKLKAIGLTDGAKVTWSSEDKNIAKVTKYGNVTAKSEGYVLINAKVTKGDKVETHPCSITVTNNKNTTKINLKDNQFIKSYDLNGKKAMDVSIFLPSVTVKDNAAASKKINKFFTKIKKEAIATATDYLPSYEEFNYDEAGIVYSTEYDYFISCHNGNLLSIDVNYDSFFGGPHPWTGNNGYVFDLSTGNRITFKKLFKNHNHAADVVWSALRNQLVNDEDFEYDIEYFDAQRDFWPSLDKKFVIDENGFVFTLSAGDLFPYAVGPVSWNVSIDDLKPYLSSYGKNIIK